MAQEAYRLRADLEVSPQASRDGTVFVIKDPSTARFFRLGPSEYSIVRQLDGTRTLDAVRGRVEAESGASLPLPSLERFVERLRGLGLLDEPGAPDAPRPRGPVRGSLLYLRLKAFDPRRVLDRLAGVTRFFFTPYFLAVSAGIILLAAVVTVSEWPSIGRDFLRLQHLQALFLAWLTVVLVIVAHEFAHGLTCRHFGGTVREMGFLLIYFHPAFYCNVSDAWLFPEKSKRLWVTFAGAYFEVFLWALSTFAWRLTEPGTFPNDMALVVMATSGVKTLFNLNPLIKLDGYYILSDWLEIPNLRSKAFAYLSLRTRTLLGGPRPTEESTGLTSRERRIFLVYGFLAGAYSLWLLGLVFRYLGGYLVQTYQGWGFLLFAGLLGVVLRAPVSRGLRGVPPMLGIGLGLKRAAVRLAKVLGVAVPAALVLFLGRVELKVSGEFTILPIQNADVRAEVDGIVEAVYVEEGSAVTKGDLIARLADTDYRNEAAKIRAEIDERQAILRMLRAGAREEEVQLSITGVEKAEGQLRHSEIQLARLELLFDGKLVSQKELDDGRAQVAVRQKELEEARGRLKVLQAGSRPEQIEALEAEIARLRAQQRYLSEQLRSVEVRSPIEGTVTTRNLKELVGEAVEKGDLIAKVHELDAVAAEIAVPEKEISDVSVGQRVLLRARAHPGTTFEGTVTSIAPTATPPGEGRVERIVVVTTRLDNRSHLLKSEMTGNAKIHCGRRRLVDVLTRRTQRYFRVEFWSWW